MSFKKRKIRRTIVFVIDALRPDSISLENTPYLYHLMKDSIRFANSHAIFPTLTRVSAAAMGTGAHPFKNGILGNSIYEPSLDRYRAVDTGSLETILKLSKAKHGAIVNAKTLAERFAENNLKYTAISSGTAGMSLLLNPVALHNCGVLINGYMKRNEIVAFPESINQEILECYPGSEDEPTSGHTYGRRVSWTEDIARDYVIEKLDSDIIINWIAEPDHSQHYYDVGSPQAVEMMKLVDMKVKDVIEKVIEREEFEETNFFVLSDHGCSKCSNAINLEESLISYGLKAGSESEDAIIADNGQMALIHVKDRNPEKVKDIVEYLQKQAWTDLIFTAPKDTDQGIIKGTFSLDLIHMWNEQYGPDIVLTFPWSSAKNDYGYPGQDYEIGDFQGEIKGAKSSHGSLSPYTIRNVMFAFGPDFKKNTTTYVPVNMLDVVATLLHLYGIESDDDIDGRVIDEIFAKGTDVEKIPVSTVPHSCENPDLHYKAVLQMSYVGGKHYLDKGWRVR